MSNIMTRRLYLYTALALLAVAALSTSARASEPVPTVNVNTATAAQLSYLPGIGDTIAARIVDDRAANGPYADAEQLTRVKGIGPAKLAKIRPYVTLDGSTTATAKIK